MDNYYGRDAFYEESAVLANAVKAEKRYKVMHILSIISLVLSIFMFFMFFMFFPFGSMPTTEEEAMQFQAYRAMFGFVGGQSLVFLALWFFLFKWKARLNVSYDYCFVSGELRISKVVNINKRKLLTRFDCREILQIGDIDNEPYNRLSSDPATKRIVCTSNIEPLEGKFFMYILINDNGKKLYILECKEDLLVQIMKFAPRNVLEKEYVSQEKKKNKV